MILNRIFPHDAPVKIHEEEEYKLSDVDNNLIKQYPFLDDMRVLELYKYFLLHAGHCPECNDFLYPDILSNGDGSYTVVKNCMDRNCDYSLDISDLFNEGLGINTKKTKDKTDDVQVPPRTGTLKNSVPHVLKKDATIPSTYYGIGPVRHRNEPDWVMVELRKILPNCPECMDYNWVVSSTKDIPRMRMEAQACCQNCHAVYDISSYYGLVAFKEAPDIIKRDYGVESLKDCEMILLSPGRKTETKDDTVYCKSKRSMRYV